MDTTPFVIAGLVVADQAVWTIRNRLVNRGRRRAGSALGVLNAIIAVSAVAQVVTNLDQPWNIVGYAAGVGVGTYLGSAVEERVPGGATDVLAIVDGDHVGVVSALRGAGWPATTIAAGGLAGPVTVLLIVVDRRRAGEVVEQIRGLAPESFVMVSEPTKVLAPPLGDRFRQVAA